MHVCMYVCCSCAARGVKNVNMPQTKMKERRTSMAGVLTAAGQLGLVTNSNFVPAFSHAPLALANPMRSGDLSSMREEQFDR